MIEDLSSVIRAGRRFLAAAAAAAIVVGCGGSQTETTGPTMTSSDNTTAGFEASLNDLKVATQQRMEDGVPVPVPADGGGGYTHEQHKQNTKTIYESAMLYRLTGDDKYRDFAVSILDEYADLYPTLGLHPKRKENHPAGRLFWQGLNEAWWLVYAIQGYDVLKDDITEEQREKLEGQLFRPISEFLSEGSPGTFNRIHNHGTWSAAAVGMTGYVLDDRDYVDKALYGLDKSGEAGFMKQIELLFSPDGYYTEGPYYQRYAMMPFLLFAQAINDNDPDAGIFDFRDGVLRKAIRATIQSSYGGRFYPINDAIREKGLNTAELRYGVAIAYDLSKDPTLLSIAQQQSLFVPTPEGKAVADAIDSGLAEPFEYRTLMLRDGPNAEGGALITLRSGPEVDAAAVVVKATSQGLGHGHFDRLGLLYYDNGDEVIADYGASRFLNVEPKNGGHYLLENRTWAKQTVAHNTLVVDETSHFGGDWRVGEEHSPSVLAFDDTPGRSFVSAKSSGAYDGVDFVRTVAMVEKDSGGQYIIDVMTVDSETAHTYDMPVHFRGQLIETSIPFEYATDSLQPLGTSSGYEHLWKTGEAPAVSKETISDFSFVLDDQFYSLKFKSTLPLANYLTRLGANDPDNNLRNEQALIMRGKGSRATFVSIFERHGRYDNDEEVTIYNGSSIADIDIATGNDVDIVTVTPQSGAPIIISLAHDHDPSLEHQAEQNGQSLSWTGSAGLHIGTQN